MRPSSEVVCVRYYVTAMKGRVTQKFHNKWTACKVTSFFLLTVPICPAGSWCQAKVSVALDGAEEGMKWEGKGVGQDSGS
jgi:hypothetical protein